MNYMIHLRLAGVLLACIGGMMIVAVWNSPPPDFSNGGINRLAGVADGSSLDAGRVADVMVARYFLKLSLLGLTGLTLLTIGLRSLLQVPPSGERAQPHRADRKDGGSKSNGEIAAAGRSPVP